MNTELLQSILSAIEKAGNLSLYNEVSLLINQMGQNLSAEQMVYVLKDLSEKPTNDTTQIAVTVPVLMKSGTITYAVFYNDGMISYDRGYGEIDKWLKLAPLSSVKGYTITDLEEMVAEINHRRKQNFEKISNDEYASLSKISRDLEKGISALKMLEQSPTIESSVKGWSDEDLTNQIHEALNKIKALSIYASKIRVIKELIYNVALAPTESSVKGEALPSLKSDLRAKFVEFVNENMAGLSYLHAGSKATTADRLKATEDAVLDLIEWIEETEQPK